MFMVCCLCLLLSAVLSCLCLVFGFLCGFAVLDIVLSWCGLRIAGF